MCPSTVNKLPPIFYINILPTQSLINISSITLLVGVHDWKTTMGNSVLNSEMTVISTTKMIAITAGS